MFFRATPSLTKSSPLEIADAPAPLMTSLISARRLPVSYTAFTSAAPEMMAVPCWSSWKTGMSIIAFNFSSM